jgi:hypothetical protein
MHNAVSKLTPAPDHVLIDGNRSPWGHPEASAPARTIAACSVWCFAERFVADVLHSAPFCLFAAVCQPIPYNI